VFSYVSKNPYRKRRSNFTFQSRLISVAFIINVHENLCYDSTVLYMVL
jgi:hypothetical protein